MKVNPYNNVRRLGTTDDGLSITADLLCRLRAWQPANKRAQDVGFVPAAGAQTPAQCEADAHGRTATQLQRPIMRRTMLRSKHLASARSRSEALTF